MITGTVPRWQIFPAPDPTEIYWANHTPNVGSCYRQTLYCIGILLSFVLVIFWIIPVTFATGLANLQTIASLPGLGWLSTFVGANATVKSIIEGFLPQLIIIIFFILLVPIIELIVRKFFLPLNRTDKIRYVIIIYFIFKVVNIYCAGLLSNSFWKIINQLELIAEQPITLANLLGEAVPAQAIFFINYVTVAALRESMLALWKPGALVFERLGLCCLASTPRDLRDLYIPEMFIFQVSYPDRIFVLIVVLCYSNIAPLILPFGFLYFVFMTLTETHRLLYVCRRKSLGGGLVWCTMFNQGCFGVGMYGVTMLGVFATKKFVAGVVISILVVLAVILFAYCMNKRWFPTAYYGSYDSMIKHNKIIPANSNVFHNLYVHPSLLPVPPEKLEFYGTEGETVQTVPLNQKPLPQENDKLSEMNSDTDLSVEQRKETPGTSPTDHSENESSHKNY